MADNDDYMDAKAYDDNISETMWDRLQEGINANRRFRLKGIVGGNNMRYSSTKVVWDSDIYIYFTRESDGAWVYNKINANPTTGVACGNDDVLYVVLNDTTATVLTVTAADYTSMPTDDTGRILILGAVRDSRWYGISSTDISHDSILGVSIDDHHAQSHNNTYHTTNYEVANANIQTHVGSPPADSHHTRYADSEVESVITDELVNGQSIDLAIDSLILTHKNIATAHHTKTTSFGDLTDDIVYTQVDAIVDTSGAGASNLISRADHVHTAGDGSSKITYSNLLSIPSTFAPSEHDNGAHSPDFATASALTSHTGAANPHSSSASDTDLSTHAGDTSTHGKTTIAGMENLHAQSHNNTYHTTNYAPEAGSSSIVTVGTLTGGSIGVGFTDINIERLDELLHDLLMYGSDNSAWVNCAYTTHDGSTRLLESDSSGRLYSTSSTNVRWMGFVVPLPLNKGNKSLWIKGIRILLDSVTTTNYITNMYCRAHNASGYVTVHSDGTDRKTNGVHTYGPFTAYDLANFNQCMVMFDSVLDFEGAGKLGIAGVEVDVYYA